MKKKDLILIAGVIIVILIAIFATKGTEAKNTELPIALSGEEVGLIKIDYATYKSKVENNENFIVIIERTGCGYCEMYLPIVEEVTNELSIPVYYIDTADLSADEYNELSSSNVYLKRNKWGTPTTLLMSEGTVVTPYDETVIGGYVEKDELLNYLNNNIILEENNSIEE